jgi:hypothetical protein
MSHSADLLQRVHRAPELIALLADAFEFDVRRGAVADDSNLASGSPLESIAGDFTGGTFYLCGNPESTRPVLYASSEGEAGIIAKNLSEALALVVGLPYWRSCLTYSADGDLGAMESASAFLQREMMTSRPTIDAEQSRAAELLGLPLEPASVLVSRLRVAVKSFGSDVFSDVTGEYGSLFGPFPPSRNARWH